MENVSPGQQSLGDISVNKPGGHIRAEKIVLLPSKCRRYLRIHTDGSESTVKLY
jgi:hypothetical protein